MTTLFALLLTVLLQTLPTAPAPATSAASGPLTAESPVDQILEALDARGQNLRTLSARVELTESDPAIGSRVVRAGRFWLDNDPATTRARVRFETRTSGNRVRDEVIEYLLAGDTLVDRDVARKREVRRKIGRPGEKLNLLRLGEGPFPLPIGQDRADVLREFDVAKVGARKDDPPNTVRLRLVPKPDSSFSKRFDAMDVWVGLADAMPRRILVDDGDAGMTRTTDLADVQINADLGPDEFNLPPIDPKEWDIIEEQMRQ
jgi:hypothetical protein